jgi:2'-5' RNA ligase
MQRVSVFFAVRPPPPFCPKIESLRRTIRRAHGLHGTDIAQERLHNTVASVYHPHRSLKDSIERAREAAATLRHPAFHARFEWTQSFNVHRDRYPLVLRGELAPLMNFHQALAVQMARKGLPISQNYTPHITLSWADRAVEEYPIAPLEWQVTEFVLILSISGEARHIILGHWQLG